jgi:hypothetical protein
MKPRDNPHLPGFDGEFTSLDQYIRVITARIWEGRQVESIRQYYSDPCAVITPMGASTHLQAVLDSTYATLQQFPDRRLLAEDVIAAGDAKNGFLSSHRIISTMTHLGDGNFGSATGRKVQVRTVADCVCKDNKIVHEWLVRDQGAIALALGSAPRAMALSWLSERGSQPILLLSIPAAPTFWRNPRHDHAIAQAYANAVQAMLCGQPSDDALYDEAACCLGPSLGTYYGRKEIKEFYAQYATSVSKHKFIVESLVFMSADGNTGRPVRVSMRWRLQGQHKNSARFTGSAGNRLDILGINHAEWVNVNGRWQVHREWVLIDEIAVWMQILDPHAQIRLA